MKKIEKILLAFVFMFVGLFGIQNVDAALAVKYKTTSYDILDRIEEIMAINYLNGELEKDIKKKEKIKNSCIN